MNKWIHIAALSVTLGVVWLFPVKAAPAQAPSPTSALTDWQAFQRYGYPSSLYLNGKGGRFLIYALKDGSRLMLKLLPNKMEGEGIRLSSDWKPERGGQEIKMGQHYVPGLRYISPQALRPLLPAVPHDRYHPGVKLMARADQK